MATVRRGGGPDGLLVLDKPRGLTSRAAVDRALGWFSPGAKIGHTGTLDPLATGVLVLCLGTATRLTEYVQRMEKTYESTFRLGATSTTDDADGEVIPVPRPDLRHGPAHDPRLAGLAGRPDGEVVAALPRFADEALHAALDQRPALAPCDLGPVRPVVVAARVVRQEIEDGDDAHRLEPGRELGADVTELADRTLAEVAQGEAVGGRRRHRPLLDPDEEWVERLTALVHLHLHVRVLQREVLLGNGELVHLRERGEARLGQGGEVVAQRFMHASHG